MFRPTHLYKAVLAVFGGTVFATALHAQETPPAVERVEITGSSIKRINGESALPVQVISSDEIKKSGVATVTDLIQALPAMQGFTTASQSVNGGGGGTTTASLHDLGSSYTLVLLNGRRVAPFTTGSDVNLNAIPLSAVERVEVLTDGASALYGSDAIAGVVNFITKKDTTEGLFNATGYVPQHKGGGSATVSLSKGFGDLEKNGFNVLLAASFDKQNSLNASQRPFSKSGILTWNDPVLGPSEVDLVSSNSVPANATVYVDKGDGVPHRVRFNPYRAANGSCAPLGIDLGDPRCFFDYPATVESIPSSKRASLYGSARVKVAETASLFTEAFFSRFYNDPRYAPPAQPLTITDQLIAKDINPYLGDFGYAGATVITDGGASIGKIVPLPTMNVRLYDAGGRQDRYQTDSLHWVLGGDFSLGKVDLTTTYTHSQNKQTDRAEGGYASFNKLSDLIASGAWDPLMSPAGTSASVLAPAVLHQILDSTKSSIDVLSAKGSTTVGKLSGGDIGLGFGAELNHQRYKDDPSTILEGVTDQIVGGGGGALPFDSSRNSLGLFSELVLPVSKQLELSGSARYDSYSAVKNSENFDPSGNPLPGATQGRKNSAGTWKLSARLQPTKDFLLRGSIGTGFKAPSLSDITRPLQAFGSTGMHTCPPGLSPDKAAYCVPGPYEYNEQVGGNAASDSSGLRPERSTQWTIGFRAEPANSVSFGVDLWTVRLKDQIGSVSEDSAFGNGALYDYLFAIVPDPISKAPTLTFKSVPVNTGKAVYQGLDFDGSVGGNTPIGRLTTTAHATYMLRADYQTPGVDGYLNSMNKIGADGAVTFQWILNVSASLKTGAFTNTLTANFKPGYKDDYTDFCYNPDANGNCNADSQNRMVGDYSTFDWQTKYEATKDLAVTVGLKNMFDRKPPFSLIDQGGTGNARGFDGRYADPIGRQFYLGASYKF